MNKVITLVLYFFSLNAYSKEIFTFKSTHSKEIIVDMMTGKMEFNEHVLVEFVCTPHALAAAGYDCTAFAPGNEKLFDFYTIGLIGSKFGVFSSDKPKIDIKINPVTNVFYFEMPWKATGPTQGKLILSGKFNTKTNNKTSH